MLMLFAAALALATAEPAPGPEAGAGQAQAPAASPSAELKPGERKVRAICKEYAPTGTRFGKKRCIEVSAYERQQEIDRQAFHETQNRPMVDVSRGN